MTHRYILTLGDSQQGARALSFAKALAPQMFLRCGTQMLFQILKVTNQAGELVATYSRLGWRDEMDTEDAQRLAAAQERRQLRERQAELEKLADSMLASVEPLDEAVA